VPSGILLDPVAELITRQARHHDVGDDHVECLVGETLQCNLGIGSEIDVKSLGFQYELKLLRLRRAILDNENPRHRLLLDRYVRLMSWSAIDGSGKTQSANPALMAAPAIPNTTELA
jgi:hypothetical protein